MKKIKIKVLPVLFFVLMIVACITPIHAQETQQQLEITLVSSENFDNNQDAMLNFNVQNKTNKEVQTNLIVGLYEKATNKIITYNYINDKILPNSNKDWGTCIQIPEQGQYTIKAYAWDNIKNPVTLSNTLVVNQYQEVVKDINDEVTEAIKKTVDYQLDTISEPSVGSTSGDWTVLSLARSSLEIPQEYYDSYYTKVVDKVKQENSKDKKRWNDKVTDVERVSLALSAIGKNPANVDGINLLDYVFNKADNFPGIKPDGELGNRQGINELIFALITIDAKDYQSEDGITRETIINRILNDYQLEDGGFALSGKTIDIDITAMTIQALAPYYNSNQEVKKAVDKSINILSNMQGNDGKYEISFIGSAKNKPSETISQVIVALTALDINPHTDERFVKNGNSLVTALLTYIDSEGGFKHVLDKNVDPMATDQGLYALIAFNRLVNDKNSLYDMSDVDFAPVGTVQISIEKRIIGKGDTVSATSVDLFEGDNVFNVLKRLVDENELSMEYIYTEEYNSHYIQSIDGDGEFDHGSGSGWMYYVNGKLPNVGVSAYFLEDSDVIRVRYTTSWGALDAPLVNVLKDKISEAEKNNEDDYTAESYKVLKNAIKEAKVIVEDESYNSTETSKELVISNNIGAIDNAVKGLVEKKEHVIVSDTIPNDFENDLWLNTNFQLLQVGETYKLAARRVPEIIDNPITNNVAHPTYKYNVIKGNSVTIDPTSDNGVNTIKAVSLGTSVIEVTYDATNKNGKDYGACSEVNKAYVVIDVTDGEDKGIDIETNIEQRSYDTIYYTEGATTDYTFEVDVTGSDDIQVLCNDEVIEAKGNKYTVQLENRNNIIEINATNDKGTEKLFYNIEARKIEITIENLSRDDDTIKVSDEVKVSFRGITLPVYKLATIYNPTFPSMWGSANDQDYARVKYNNDSLGQIKSNDQIGQYSLATRNSIKITFDKAGEYNFTDGHIDESWWGSDLGFDKEIIGSGNSNLDADVVADSFSTLPDFSIEVEENEETATNEEEILTDTIGTVIPGDVSDGSSDESMTDLLGEYVTTISDGEINIGSIMGEDIEVPSEEIDKIELIKLINEAKLLDKTSYTEESYNNLEIMLEKAEDANKKEDITQDEVNNMISQLQSAISNLETEIDENEDTTEEEIPSSTNDTNDVMDMLMSGGVNTESSNDDVTNLLGEYVTTISDGEINIGSIMGEDIEVPSEEIDKIELIKLINEAKLLDKTSYTEESYSNLEIMLEKAEVANKKEDITQDEVNDMISQLQSVMANLENKVDEEDSSEQDTISDIEITE